MRVVGMTVLLAWAGMAQAQDGREVCAAALEVMQDGAQATSALTNLLTSYMTLVYEVAEASGPEVFASQKDAAEMFAPAAASMGEAIFAEQAEHTARLAALCGWQLPPQN